MHRIRTLGLLFMLCLGFVVRAEESFVSLNFEDALKKAATDHKLVLIDFFTTWCGPCKMLDKQTWPDAKVRALLQKHVVALKIDAEKEPELAKRYLVDAYPSMVILNADGTLKDKYVGFMPPAAFIEHFEATLAGKTSLDLAVMAVEKAGQADGDQMVRARYNRGQEYARAEKFAEALADYLWCWDEGMARNRNFTGVRNSYLLSELRELAHRYPAARDAMIERREQARRTMLAGSNPWAATSDFANLNSNLGEKEENLKVFRALPKGDPRRQWLGSYQDLLAARQYEDALEAEPAGRFRQRLAETEEALQDPRISPDRDLVAYLRDEGLRELLARIPALLATGNKNEAQELREFWLKFDSREETRKALDTACAGQD